MKSAVNPAKVLWYKIIYLPGDGSRVTFFNYFTTNVQSTRTDQCPGNKREHWTVDERVNRLMEVMGSEQKVLRDTGALEKRATTTQPANVSNGMKYWRRRRGLI